MLRSFYQQRTRMAGILRTVAILAAAVGIDDDVPEAGETQLKAIQDIEKPRPQGLPTSKERQPCSSELRASPFGDPVTP